MKKVHAWAAEQNAARINVAASAITDFWPARFMIGSPMALSIKEANHCYTQFAHGRRAPPTDLSAQRSDPHAGTLESLPRPAKIAANITPTKEVSSNFQKN